MRGKRDTGCLTPFLKPSLSNDGDIAHGFFTPSLMPLHACSTEREREEGRGERREKEKERERRRGGGGWLSQPPRHSPSLPFPFTLSVVQSPSQEHTQTHGVYVYECVSFCFLLWLICLPPSLFRCLLLHLFLHCLLLHSCSLSRPSSLPGVTQPGRK